MRLTSQERRVNRTALGVSEAMMKVHNKSVPWVKPAAGE